MMAALLIATTVAWIALEAASSTEEPALPWSSAHAGALATGLTLLAVHTAALVEHALRSTSGSLLGLALIASGIGCASRRSARSAPTSSRGTWRRRAS